MLVHVSAVLEFACDLQSAAQTISPPFRRGNKNDRGRAVEDDEERQARGANALPKSSDDRPPPHSTQLTSLFFLFECTSKQSRAELAQRPDGRSSSSWRVFARGRKTLQDVEDTDDDDDADDDDDDHDDHADHTDTDDDSEDEVRALNCGLVVVLHPGFILLLS